MMIKLRYLFGIPYLYLMAMSGQNIIFDAIVIGILAGMTDIHHDNNDKMRPS